MDVLTVWGEEGLVLRAGPVDSSEERAACLRLRYWEYHDKQQEVPDNENGHESDWADAHSTIFCTKLNDDPGVVGTARLIACEHGCLLLNGFDPATAGRGQGPASFSGQPFVLPKRNPRTGAFVQLDETMEGSRYVARRIKLGNGRELLHSVILLQAGFEYCRRNGKKQMIAAFRDFHFAFLTSIGWDMIELIPREDGQPHDYHRMRYRVALLPIPDDRVHDYSGIRVIER